MRFQGTIKKWKDEEGYGFITPRGGGNDVFLHARAFDPNQNRPVGNEVVTYEVTIDEKGRERATSVRFVGFEPSSGYQWSEVKWPVFVAAVTLGVLIVFTKLGHLHFFVPLIVLAASLVTFLLYAHDKSQAQAKGWRVSEKTLHLFSLVGGWPGALIAQQLYRHKLRKPVFMALFWLTVLLNCVAIVIVSVARPY